MQPLRSSRPTDAPAKAQRTDHLYYNWDHLRPEQQRAALDLIDTARVSGSARRRRRVLLLMLLVLADIAVVGIVAYLLLVAH
jgi:hypothetical protein